MTTKTIECENAKSLLETISPIGPHLSAFENDSWIFRGEGSIATPTPLVPSALRPSNLERLIALAGLTFPKPDNMSEATQESFEFLVLGKFFREADRFGLSIPEDRQELRRKFQHEDRTLQSYVDHFQYEDWLPNELLSLAGLAQHYGLPTRLLDWTRNHLAAAYFASKDAVRTNGADDGTSLTVWALNESVVYRWDELFFKNDGPLQIITAPAALNPNLRAQQGLFTLWRGRCSNEEPVNRDPLNELLANYDKEEARMNKLAFFQFKLPAQQARSLLEMILALGVTAGALFPGFKGVTQSLEDHALVCRSESPNEDPSV